METAKALTKENQWGALVYDDTGYEQTFSVMNGSEDGIYSKDGKRFTLADPKGIEAVQWAADLTNKHKVQPGWDILRQQGGLDLFVAGRVGMLYRDNRVVAQVRKGAKFDWDIVPVPKKVVRKTEGSLVCMGIPRQAKNPDAAWTFLNFVTSNEGMQVMAKYGQVISPRKSQVRMFLDVNKGQKPEHISLFIDGHNNGTVVNYTENTERARQIYRPQLELVYLGQKTAKEVLEGVRPEVEAVLQGKF